MLHKVDKYILISAVFLLLAGAIMVLSTAPVAGVKDVNDGFYYVIRHFIHMVMGIVICWLMTQVDYHHLRKFAGPGLIISALLLMLTYFPWFGIRSGGAARWLNLGLFSFQPAEVAKVFIVLYVANALANKKEIVRDFWHGVLPILAVSGGLVLAILKQPDLGTSLVIISTVFVMLIIAGSNFTDLLLLGLLGFRALSFWIMHTPYQLKRWTTFLNPELDPQDAGYNILQSLLAVGSGGLFGLGIGHSRQKFGWLPENHTDFIFAVICEEGGFILASLVVAAFAVLLIRGLRLAIKAPDVFGSFLVLGYTICLGVQAMVHIMVVMAWAPTKGITLPFVSYGGTSLIISLFMLGVILRISREARV